MRSRWSLGLLQDKVFRLSASATPIFFERRPAGRIDCLQSGKPRAAQHGEKNKGITKPCP
ncbi:hypothetical protein EBBID32_16170 [Sphingobium indicum BiD32]|uniref:Uncharacterized protein n=1 Tax=Sphingobium indicum BiD32 TaxID=1301087 RepID=N1MPA7_9SPHN|nr:hypothetical protein EBBID32_16170 [Sphingobium indicum BiD32]